jgi:hypothetical protein
MAVESGVGSESRAPSRVVVSAFSYLSPFLAVSLVVKFPLSRFLHLSAALREYTLQIAFYRSPSLRLGSHFMSGGGRH